MFKFDFSTCEDGGHHDEKTEEEHCSCPWAKDGDGLINNLQRRSETAMCTIVNASAQSLYKKDGHATPNTTFEPKLGFHSHETVDLISRSVEPIRYVIPQHTLSDKTTDLIPGVYEGGLKVWECSVDLCRFLASLLDNMHGSGMDVDRNKTEDNDRELDLEFVTQAIQRSITRGGLTLELGCGHGLPGCLILRENIRNALCSSTDLLDESFAVVFTDFNDFVLQHATIPNAQINTSGLRRDDGVCMNECDTAQALLKKAIFVGGDWMGLSHKISEDKRWLADDNNGRFDLILAAETTYTTDSCKDTAYLLAKHLKVETGVGLVATKRFYFGVGGGTDMFSNVIRMINSCNVDPFSKICLVMRTIKSYDTGNANIRDLLEIRCLRKSP
jgi:hypothetical protein